MTNKPIPQVGLVVQCSENDIAFRNSNIPCIRLTHSNGQWAVSPTKERGLMVYITQPQHITLDKLRAVRLTDVSPYVAKAEVIDV